MMNKLLLSPLAFACCMLLSACSAQAEKTPSKNINFIAFGDGGYHVDYPKKKQIKNPKNKTEFIAKELQDWLEDYRPRKEFDHAPIYVYPGTDIATEQGGAQAVGLAMATLCESKECQFAIQLGDNVYPDGADANDCKDDQKRLHDLIYAPLKPLFDADPSLIVYSALGNHDWRSSRKGVALQTEWMAQQPNFFMGEQGYYSYKKGTPGNDVEFFVLDTNMLLAGQTYYKVPLNPDGSEGNEQQAIKSGAAKLEVHDKHEGPKNGEDIKQLAWLKKEIANSTAKWKLVYGHHILWSIGGTKYTEGHVLRRLLMPTLCKYADGYIAGHEHDLELLTDDCSEFDSGSSHGKLPLIISGAASKMRGKHSPFAQFQAQKYPEYDLVWSKSFVWGFSHINIDNQQDQLKVSFYTTPRNLSGGLIDEGQFRFKKRTQ
ncbi:serine/threonine protein phosphatase [Pseudoalteromonas fuliginea]|uniref:Serine/threonine protein phosphatase n=1 Tax=Pseudoalteromonas fuliginea TaxID=1872678 RepID=A0AB73BGE8_9GAMM|nr:metallophosphoesterase [Pseudoalteromonas fuliginea]KAA1159834.1 serine/threonine protein phosphatase [Pseudoalteromonas fuliginea]